MKDYLLDVITHTNSLDGVDLIKITGTDTLTQVNAIADNKNVIISGTFKNPIIDFAGIFGMPNLSKLKTILSFDEYDEKSKIAVLKTNRNGEDVPSSIHFETSNGDFVNDYRLMSKELVEEKVKAVAFKGATWNIEFEPTIAGVQRLKKQASANSEEESFTVKTDKTDVKIHFGDPSTHSGNFVFQSNVSGTLNRAWMFPVKAFLNIMDMVGDKTIRISDQGVAEITVDSEISNYKYYLPAQQK